MKIDQPILDAFTHFLPPAYVEELKTRSGARHLKPLVDRFVQIPTLCDIGSRLDLLRPYKGLQQILGLALPTPEMIEDTATSIAVARAGNDGLAEIVATHTDRFPGFLASLPMVDVEGSLAEMDRAATTLGARGVQMVTSISGIPLDHPKFDPVFARAEALDIPLFLHPYRTNQVPDYPTEAASDYEISNILGWPHETSVAMARLVFSEITTRYPKLKILGHHLGGTVPYLAGRVGPMWEQLGLRSGNPKHAAIRERLGRPPIEHFKLFYADSAVGDAGALRCGLDFYGPDRVVFATDAPFGPEAGKRFIEDNLKSVEQLSLPDAVLNKLLWTNARKLLKL